MSSRYQTKTLTQPPQVQQQFIEPGKYIAIDEERYSTKPREPEKQTAYGSGVASDFKPINYGWSGFINTTELMNKNPIVNYGSYIYQQRTGYQGGQSRDMSRLFV
jgi:hypothetical protein